MDTPMTATPLGFQYIEHAFVEMGIIISTTECKKVMKHIKKELNALRTDAVARCELLHKNSTKERKQARAAKAEKKKQ